MSLTPFHLAICVDDLDAARGFYGAVLGCAEGRSAPRWVDFDLFGHQLSVHHGVRPAADSHHGVDGDSVPVPHFGVVLPWDEWHDLRGRLEGVDTAFIVGPRVRFAGEVGEQATMFFADPAGNMLEFKSFRDPARLFAAD